MFHPVTSALPDLLAEWRWLLGRLPRLHGWSSAGDLFYSDDRRQVWRLDTGRCLGFTVLPVLGGTYTVENRYALAIIEHASFTADIHRQIRDLPDGAVVRHKVIP